MDPSRSTRGEKCCRRLPRMPSTIYNKDCKSNDGPVAEKQIEFHESLRDNPTKRWHHVQHLLKMFWKRWRREFLPRINVRKKWFHPRHNLKREDVVMMVEPDANRGDWPLGRVTEVYPGEDGLVRVVRVKSRNNEYVRPIHRILVKSLNQTIVTGGDKLGLPLQN